MDVQKKLTQRLLNENPLLESKKHHAVFSGTRPQPFADPVCGGVPLAF